MMLAKIMSKVHGVPFKVNGTDASGLDCLGLIYHVYKKQGKKIPESFGEWNKENYSDLYLADHEKAIEVATEYFDSFMEKIDPAFIVSGDVILLKSSKSKPYLAMYGGNGMFISTYTDSYARTFQLIKGMTVLRAWRFK